MKKLSLVLSLALMLTLFYVPTHAAVEDYATVIWEEMQYKTYSGDIESIKVTLTGVVGKQIDSHTVETADVPVLLLDLYLEQAAEEGMYEVYDDTGHIGQVKLADKMAEYKEKYGMELTVIPVVDGGSLTIEMVKGESFEGYPGSYDFMDDTMTIATPGMGQAGNYGVGENGLPSLKEGEDMKSYLLEFPIRYDGSNGMNPIGILVVSEAKAAELLAAMGTEAPATTTEEAVTETPATTETATEVTTTEEATTAPVETTTDAAMEVTIQLGDTVGLLSVRYYGDYTMIDEIYAANKAYFAKTGDRLNKGDKLVLPKAPTCTVPVASEAVKVYTVQAGDTLGKIAAKFYNDGSKYTVIFEANKDKIEKASLIYEGQVLAIPVVK